MIILHCWKILRIDIKLSSLNHWAQPSLLNYFNKKRWLLFKAKNKFPDDTSLRPGWIVPLPGGAFLYERPFLSLHVLEKFKSPAFFLTCGKTIILTKTKSRRVLVLNFCYCFSKDFWQANYFNTVLKKLEI